MIKRLNSKCNLPKFNIDDVVCYFSFTSNIISIMKIVAIQIDERENRWKYLLSGSMDVFNESDLMLWSE